MITQSQFQPAMGLSNPHLQTLLPYLFNNPVDNGYIKQTLELDDGDFLDLSWLGHVHNGEPITVIFHGLESSLDSHYVPKIMQTLHNNYGWACVVMHFRGCSGRVNRLARSYHSGETGDANHVIQWLHEHYPDSPLSAIGYSLGGNVLLKLQAELGENSPLKAAVSICAPIVLDACANRMNKGFSRIYQRRLVSCLNQKILDKSDFIDYKKLINMDKNAIASLRSFWEFDNLITAPLHGFKDVHDYYAQSSARQYLGNIKKPTLIIHALDDPFMTPDVVPLDNELSPKVEFELCQHGGHIGFISGSIFRPIFWLQHRIPEYLLKFVP